MADILTKELGVQEERLLLEEEARSTVENAVNVLRYTPYDNLPNRGVQINGHLVARTSLFREKINGHDYTNSTVAGINHTEVLLAFE